MSLQSHSDLERFFQELYILTTKASWGRLATQEDFCHSLGLVGDERLNGKPERKGCVWFLWVENVCDGWVDGLGRQRGKVHKEGMGVCRYESHF